jgi:hypothetical protein
MPDRDTVTRALDAAARAGSNKFSELDPYAPATWPDVAAEVVRAYLDALDPAEVQKMPDVYIHTVDVEDIIKAVRP